MSSKDLWIFDMYVEKNEQYTGKTNFYRNGSKEWKE